MKIPVVLFLICAAFLSFLPPAAAEDVDNTVSLKGANPDLPELIEYALQNNPKIQADHQKWIAKTKQAIQAGALPDPTFNYTYFGESIQTRVGPERQKYGFSQSTPFPGKLYLKRKAVAKEADMLKEKYDYSVRSLIQEVKFIYYDMFWLDRAISITKQEKSVLENLENVARKKFETGLAPQQDVVKAEVEISKIIENLTSLRQHRKSVESRMNSVLNMPGGILFSEIKEVTIDEFNRKLDGLREITARENQEILAAGLDRERAKYERSLAGLDYLPDFSFGFDFMDIASGYTNMDTDGQNAWSTTFAVKVPIWLDKQVSEVREKQASLTASEKNYEDTKNRVIYELEDVYYKITAYKDIMLLYKTALVPQTEQSFEASRTGYESGKVDFLNWLNAERVLLRTKLAYYKAIADYEKSIAYLERLVGKDL